VVELSVPKDGQTGVYRIGLNVQTEGGDVQGQWGVESPDLRKVAYELDTFNFWGGHVFFFVPKGTESFRIKVTPRPFAARQGEIPVFGPNGAEYARLDAMKPKWVEIRPAPEQTGGVWGIVLLHVGVFEMDGLPPYVYADPTEFFLP